MWSLGFLRMLLCGFLFIFLFQSDVCTDGNFVTFCSLSLYSVLWKICWRSMLVQQLRMLISFYIMYFYIIEFLDSQVFLSNAYNFTSGEIVLSYECWFKIQQLIGVVFAVMGASLIWILRYMESGIEYYTTIGSMLCCFGIFVFKRLIQYVTKLSGLGQGTWYMYIVSQNSIMVLVKVFLLVNDGISHVPWRNTLGLVAVAMWIFAYHVFICW